METRWERGLTTAGASQNWAAQYSDAVAVLRALRERRALRVKQLPLQLPLPFEPDYGCAALTPYAACRYAVISSAPVQYLRPVSGLTRNSAACSGRGSSTTSTGQF